jgi:hypothetical protein
MSLGAQRLALNLMKGRDGLLSGENWPNEAIIRSVITPSPRSPSVKPGRLFKGHFVDGYRGGGAMPEWMIASFGQFAVDRKA